VATVRPLTPPAPMVQATRPRVAVAQTAAPSAAPLVLDVHGLHKWYGDVHALDGVDLQVHRGEVMGFLGPNGAGKTTFTRCVLGFLRSTRGTVSLFGQSMPEHAKEVLARVGVVPDQYDFYGNLNGRQHLEFYGRLHGIPRTELGARIDEVVGLTGMADFVGRRVRGYSHGMKQRLCIAQALINRPQFIVFDEPTNGLDPKGAYETRSLIKSLRSKGTTVFLNSHILTEVEDVCSRVAILSRGRVLVQASVSELRSRMRGNQVRVTITLEKPTPGVESLVLQRGVAQRATLTDDRLVCELGPGQEIPELVATLVKGGARVKDVKEEVLGLEQMFLQLTQGQGGV
jgi:ABC-type multidrug transport system ATPase subunit